MVKVFSGGNKVGRLVRSKRKKLKLTQQELAEKAGISQVHVCQIENKPFYFQPRTARGLARALGLNLAKLWVLVPKRMTREPQTGLGKLILSRRQELGLTQKEVAQLTRLSQSRVRKLERGSHSKLRIRSARCLARALKCKVSLFRPFLYDGKGPKATRRPSETQLGRLIRSRRLVLGLTQGQLGARLGTTPQAVSLREIGREIKDCQGDVLRKLARVLNLELARLQKLRSPRKVNKVGERRSPLGGYLTSHRLELGLTQKGLAEKAGINSNYLSLIERGWKQPSPNILKRIVRVLKCGLPSKLLH